MSTQFNVLVLPGDGVGPEVVGHGARVIKQVAERFEIDIQLQWDLLGGQAWDKYGTFCRDQTAEAAANSDAILIGAVGGPKWDNMLLEGTPAEKDGLMRLREELDTYVGMRPAKSYPALSHMTPFKTELVANSDILVVREMCGGLMFREPKEMIIHEDGSQSALDTNLYTSDEVERIARAGLSLARRRKCRLASMDKSNVMESGILWRNCVDRIASTEFPDVELEHYFADNGFYQMMRRPGTFDVVLGDNLFGDLASDLAATVSGSLGMLPSACLPHLNDEGVPNGPGIYEPVHGSAPDIAGKGIANPIGTILSVAMMFEFGMGRKDISRKIESSVESCLEKGIMTPDLGGIGTSDQVANTILEAL